MPTIHQILYMVVEVFSPYGLRDADTVTEDKDYAIRRLEELKGLYEHLEGDVNWQILTIYNPALTEVR